MDMELENEILTLTQRYVNQVIKPRALELDEKEEFPIDIINEIGEYGLLGIIYPSEYGGLDMGLYSMIQVIKELAKGSAAIAMTVVAHSLLSGYPIFKYGSKYLKDKYLPGIINGQIVAAFALTEETSGSDALSLETSAVKTDEGYVLNGKKVFITNANYADVFIVAARTSNDKMLGITLFAVDKNAKGLSVSGKTEKKLGVRCSDTGELYLDNVVVPKEAVIGKKNLGVSALNSTLCVARIGMAAIALGISLECKQLSMEYVLNRKQFNQSIFNFQLIKEKIAQMEMKTDISELLISSVCSKFDCGENIQKFASEAKLFSTDMVMEITREAIQIFGAYGYSRDLPLERYYRDAKITEIGDGTSEIQKIIIADEAIKQLKEG